MTKTITGLQLSAPHCQIVRIRVIRRFQSMPIGKQNRAGFCEACYQEFNNIKR